ncbi:universal stress protein [Chryseobacterium sp. RG1]|uniref:Universal stress protein n=1 Tax=Chryseobacterium tagetis TaxID=2801334 RepID=A0ABS8A647_9FLAO|nr:universal stress protein [Chryseobacterium tagetis]MCA6068385.1 universal stress protein [Chryseobacterium tagetis]
MRTILVPVDTTSTTENAVKLSADWAKQYGYEHIILLKTNNESVFEYLHIAEGHSFVNEESINMVLKNTEELLEKLSQIILEKSPEIKVSKATTDMSLIRSINDIIKNQEQVELIILGSDDNTSVTDSFISENIIDIARTSPIKTLIVPNNYTYTPIRNILIPCDVESIAKLDRLFHYKSIIHQKDIHLSLLNINKKANNDVTDSKKEELEKYIQENLNDIPNSIHYSYDENIINGILSFASLNKTDLVIALPGRHSFLYYLANRSISEGIYQNANQPVLILK